jgi:2-polyprenyl-6-methoxyphenol hydroxylase-like FAD-dependent oxidoreductase
VSLKALYRDTPHVARILDAATEVGRPVPHHTLAEVPRWHDDRVVLIGDAVHPVGAGQGAAMAIEDAVILARVLAERGAGRQALAAFAEARRGRVAKVLKTAGENSAAKNAGRLKRRVNEAMMGFVIPRYYERATGWLYDFDPNALATPRM